MVFRPLTAPGERRLGEPKSPLQREPRQLCGGEHALGPDLGCTGLRGAREG